MEISTSLRNWLTYASQQRIHQASLKVQHEELHGTREFVERARRDLRDAKRDTQELHDLLASIPQSRR